MKFIPDVIHDENVSHPKHYSYTNWYPEVSRRPKFQDKYKVGDRVSGYTYNNTRVVGDIIQTDPDCTAGQFYKVKSATTNEEKWCREVYHLNPNR